MTEAQEGYGAPMLVVGGIAIAGVLAAVATCIAGPLAVGRLLGARYERERSA